MAPSKKPWWLGLALLEQILELVAQLRYYLGGENYTSRRYHPAHTMLFVAEQLLRALDLDGEGLLVLGDDEIISLGPSEAMNDLWRAMERLSEEVKSMEAAVKEAGAGGRNGGAAAAAQRAAARWLDDSDRLPRLVYRLDDLVSLCSHAKYVLDERRREAELEQLDREELFAVPTPESVENAKCRGPRKWRLRLRRLLRRFIT